jgi:hypothetical protein
MMNCRIAQTLALLGSLSLALPTLSDQVFQHQGKPPQLIELYTSEGCSSCPPADQFLGNFLNNPNLWTDFVPLAFHVDYWDYLGWKDPFAQTKFKDQQYSYRRNGNIKSVYTPGWLVDGKEWRGFFQSRKLPTNTQKSGGLLQAILNNKIKNQELKVSYQPPQEQNKLTAHVAVIGFDQYSEVTAGENRGRSFLHQFVVLHHQSKQQESYDWQFTLPSLQEKQRYALAVWITTANKAPLQATANWIE